MATCLFCSKSFELTRPAKYCSTKCRVYAARRRAREEKQKQRISEIFDRGMLIEQFHSCFPGLAQSKAFADAQAAGCAEAAIKLCLAAHNEALKRSKPREVEQVVQC